jgi:hypothetical protein
VTLKVGPLRIPVSVYGGTYKPPSSRKACIGHEGEGHEPMKLQSLGQKCPVCNDLSGTMVMTNDVGGKTVVLEAGAEVAALEASDKHRNEMPLVRVTREAYEAAVLESADVYWLTPEDSEPDDIYTALALELDDPTKYVVTRWASRKNVDLYRIVGRGSLLGMIKLLPGGELRSAPIEPQKLSVEAEQEARALVGGLLEKLTGVDSTELQALTKNPHREALEAAAVRNEEGGLEYVHTTQRTRNNFGDNLASASLAALLAEAEEGLE